MCKYFQNEGDIFCGINGVDLKGLGNPAWRQLCFRFLVSGGWSHPKLGAAMKNEVDERLELAAEPG